MITWAEQEIARIQQEMEDSIFEVLNCEDFKQRLLASGCDVTKADQNAEVLAVGLMESWVGDYIRTEEARYPNCPLDSRLAFKRACVRVIQSIPSP